MRDLLGGIVFLVFGGLVLLFGWDLPMGTARVPGPGVMPIFGGIMIVLLSLALIGQGLRVRAGGEPANDAEPANWQGIARVALSVVMVGLVVLLLPLFGFLACSVALMAGLALLASDPGGRLKAIVFGALVAGTSYLLFVYALQVPMPAGTFWSM